MRDSLDVLRDRVTVDMVRGREAQFRRACQTSLRFLVNCVLRPASNRFLPLRESFHGAMIDSFLRPDPERHFSEWSSIKERVTLAPRGGLKSTIVAGFITQVILCDPNIRLIVLSGKLPHARTIKLLATRPFASNEVIQLLFPELSIGEHDVGGDDFMSPGRDPALNLRDPTVVVGSFESVKAGGHHEVAILDDCTNEINCATPELVEKNEQYYDDTDPLIEPGGYRHFLGTRWAPDDVDLPEVIRRRGELFEEETGQRNTSYFAVPVWKLREGKTPEEQAGIQERDRRNMLKAEDVILAWPEKLSAQVLWPKYRRSPRKFRMQYLLRYQGTFLVDSFSQELLVRSTRPFAEGAPLPHDRFTVVRWDMGGIYSGRRPKSASDFSCGFAVMFELSTGRCFLYDAVLDVFGSSTDAASAIVKFYARQLQVGPVGICSVEDSSGVRMLEGEINLIARQLGVPIRLTWDPIDSTFDSKAVAVSVLAGAMKSGKVQFSTTLPQRDEVFRQFTRWSPRHQRVKDDAPDNLAQVWKRYSGQIFPGSVANMQPSGQVIAWEPEVPVAEDPHREEKEYADIAWLSEMTAPHA